MPVICRLPGGSGNGSGETSELSLNIFTQPDEPEIKDGLWIQRANSHKKIVVDNLISTSGEWSNIYDAPFKFEAVKPALYNGQIMAFDSSYNLWAFDGSTWTQVGSDSSNIYGPLCVVNNALFCVCSNAQLDSEGYTYGPAIFKWNGTTWTKTANIPVSDMDMISVDSCVVYNNYIYMFKIVTNSSAGNQTTQLMKTNGSSFSTAASSNYVIYSYGHGVALNDTIYWLGYYFNSSSTVDISLCLITSNGRTITLPSTNNTPFTSVAWNTDVFDSIIHGILHVSDVYMHYTFDGTTWTKLFDMSQTYETYPCAYNTRLYILGNTKYMYYSKTHEKYEPHTLILQIADTHDGPYVTALVKTSDVVENSRFLTNFNDVFFVGDSGLETTDPIYYGNGTKWIKFKN